MIYLLGLVWGFSFFFLIFSSKISWSVGLSQKEDKLEKLRRVSCLKVSCFSPQCRWGAGPGRQYGFQVSRPQSREAAGSCGARGACLFLSVSFGLFSLSSGI